MATHEEASAKALTHTANMMTTILDQGAVPLIVIAARPEDESIVVIGYPGSNNKTIIQVLEETLSKLRLQPEKFEEN